jgi:hypothetical protein
MVRRPSSSISLSMSACWPIPAGSPLTGSSNAKLSASSRNRRELVRRHVNQVEYKVSPMTGKISALGDRSSIACK